MVVVAVEASGSCRTVRQLRLSFATRRGFHVDINDCHHDAFWSIGQAKHIHMDELILPKMTVTHQRISFTPFAFPPKAKLTLSSTQTRATPPV
jgi:hypothetical protein